MLKDFILEMFSREGRWGLLTAGLVVSGVFALMCHHDSPTPLPPSVTAQVERHVVESAVDSVSPNNH